MTTNTTNKSYEIKFYCKAHKKSENRDEFKKRAASLGSHFYLSYKQDKIPVFTTQVVGVWEVYGLMTQIESICSTVVEIIESELNF